MISLFYNDFNEYLSHVGHHGTNISRPYVKTPVMEVRECEVTILEASGYPKNHEYLDVFKFSFEAPDMVLTKTKNPGV